MLEISFFFPLRPNNIQHCNNRNMKFLEQDATVKANDLEPLTETTPHALRCRHGVAQVQPFPGTHFPCAGIFLRCSPRRVALPTHANQWRSLGCSIRIKTSIARSKANFCAPLGDSGEILNQKHTCLRP